ncbi:hypothetical protein [Streptomyces sp. NPDC047028]|uniref:hypothetical protein n=1 Tax=Streptomyces sp. NPDC047028 TaxID=3155793 RepID=UPI0034014E4D
MTTPFAGPPEQDESVSGGSSSGHGREATLETLVKRYVATVPPSAAVVQFLGGVASAVRDSRYSVSSVASSQGEEDAREQYIQKVLEQVELRLGALSRADENKVRATVLANIA